MTKKQRAIELAMPTLMVVVSLLFIAESLPMGQEGLFPLLCGVLQLIVSAFLFFRALLQGEAKAQFKGRGFARVLMTILALCIYVLVMGRIGYILSTFALVLFIIAFLGYRKTSLMLLCAAATVAATYILFGVLLHVPLPTLIFS